MNLNWENSFQILGPVRTPHLASTLRQAPALETPERPTVGDNVTREILERRREIEELRNRWDKKRKEVENKFPVSTHIRAYNLAVHFPGRVNIKMKFNFLA